LSLKCQNRYSPIFCFLVRNGLDHANFRRIVGRYVETYCVFIWRPMSYMLRLTTPKRNNKTMKTKRNILAAAIVGVLGLGTIAALVAGDFGTDKSDKSLTQNQTEVEIESTDPVDELMEEVPVQESDAPGVPPLPLEEPAVLPSFAFVETSLDPSTPRETNPPIIDPAVQPVVAEVGLYELPDVHAPSEEASELIPLVDPALDPSGTPELLLPLENGSLEARSMEPIDVAFNDTPASDELPSYDGSTLPPWGGATYPEMTQETSLQDVPPPMGDGLLPLGSPVESPVGLPMTQEPSNLPPLLGNPLPGEVGGIPGYVPPLGSAPGTLPAQPVENPVPRIENPPPMLIQPGSGLPDTIDPPGTLSPIPPSSNGGTGLYPLEAQGVVPTGSLGSGLPGNSSEDGLQIPQLQIEKISPEDARIGVPAVFKTVVRNVGNVPAQSVEVWDLVPQGSRLVSSEPLISGNGPNQELVWELGLIQPNEERTVEMTIMPMEEGEIGSVSTVRFAAVASARTIVTRPMLEIALAAPSTVPIGGEATISITLSNPGSGYTTGIVLEEAVPEGLEHPAGREIIYAFGDLAPGESRQLDLDMQCMRPGEFVNLLTARADANLEAHGECRFEVVAPQLELAVEGAHTRFLEQNAEYRLVFTNTGTASARNVLLTAYLPQGLQFVGTDDASQGVYDASEHAVHWELVELPAGVQAIVILQTLPTQAGEGSLRFVGSEATGLSAEKTHPVVVDGIPAISYQVSDSRDPVEVGGETTYEIRVENEGTKASSNVQIVVQVPSQLEVTSIDGPTGHREDISSVSFDPIPRLEAKTEAVYTIVARGVQAGEARFKVQVSSDESQLPITTEESTQIFAGE
jgi:uncharacterized repeat protein (TIGR01451 family)